MLLYFVLHLFRALNFACVIRHGVELVPFEQSGSSSILLSILVRPAIAFPCSCHPLLQGCPPKLWVRQGESLRVGIFLSPSIHETDLLHCRVPSAQKKNA